MTLIALLLTLAGVGGSVDESADARCAYVLSFVGNRGGPQASSQSAAGVLYFVGKLRGRNAGVDLDAVIRMAGLAAKQAGLDPRSEMSRCVAELRSTDAATSALRARIAREPAPQTQM